MALYLCCSTIYCDLLYTTWVVDSKGIKSNAEVERLRENVYGTLEEYCRTAYPEEPGRFAKLLLRLPALRSIGM